MVEATGWARAPRIVWTAVRPCKQGSSPYASKVRPATGTRAMSAAGPSWTLSPVAKASLPIALAYRRAAGAFHVAASATGAASQVRGTASQREAEIEASS